MTDFPEKVKKNAYGGFQPKLEISVHSCSVLCGIASRPDAAYLADPIASEKLNAITKGTTRRWFKRQNTVRKNNPLRPCLCTKYRMVRSVSRGPPSRRASHSIRARSCGKEGSLLGSKNLPRRELNPVLVGVSDMSCPLYYEGYTLDVEH